MASFPRETNTTPSSGTRARRHGSRRPSPGNMERTTVDRNENVSAQRKSSAHVTAEECREQARHCLQEANKVRANPGPYSAWLKIAERWLEVANSMKLKSSPV